MVLVDAPGTGDLNSRVAVAAEGALKSSSAYVFITTYEELQSAENASFIQNLHAHDRRRYRYTYACIRMKVFRDSTKSGLRTLDWIVDWTLDSIMDSIIGLKFRLPGVRGHTQLHSSKTLIPSA